MSGPEAELPADALPTPIGLGGRVARCLHGLLTNDSEATPPTTPLAERTDAPAIYKEAEELFRSLPDYIRFPQTHGRHVPLLGSGISPRASVDLLVRMTDEEKARYIGFSERMERWFELTDPQYPQPAIPER